MDPLTLGRLLGDVVDPFTSSVSLRIAYNNNSEVVNCSDFKPSQITKQPRVDVGGDDFRTFYTLIMVDPDAPSPTNPNMREYLHWYVMGHHLITWMNMLVINIPGTTGASFGQEIMKYESPEPTAGIHRIVFVLYKQMVGRQLIHAPTWRNNFNTRDFAQVYNLGSPVAAVYFNCHRESGCGGRRMI